MFQFNTKHLPSRQSLHAHPFVTPHQPSLSSSTGPTTTKPAAYTSSTTKKTSSKRHHRTATPEQRQIRAIFKAPVYTIGIDPQADRGLLSDFFDAIQNWANVYTISLRSLSTAQIHGLLSRPGIVTCLGSSPHLTTLIMERDLLPAIVAALVSRFIVAHTMDSSALALSGHPHGTITSRLSQLWHQLHPTDFEGKKAILNAQRDIYTRIKNSPEHISWRSNCAQKLAGELTTMLSGLLNPLLPPLAVQHRSNVLQDLFVKGFRINFRLRMAPIHWDIAFPLPGATFSSEVMVNASRTLYGDAVRTMGEVGRDEEGHGVVLGVGPGMRNWLDGREEVVLKGVVHVKRR